MKAWLYNFLNRYNKVQNKIFLPFLVVMILIAAVAIYAMNDLVSSNIEGRVNDKLNNDVRLIQEIFSDMEDSLAFYAQFMADTDELAGHGSEGRESRLVIIQLLEFLRENHITSNIGRMSPLLEKRSNLNRLGMLGIRATGLLAQDKGNGKTLSLAAVAPMEGHTGGRSVITVSREIDRAFMQELAQKTGAHRVQIIYKHELIESSSQDSDSDEIIRRIVTPELFHEILVLEDLHIFQFDSSGHSLKVMLAPLSVNFKKEAVLVVHESMNDLVTARRKIVIATVLAVGIMLLIIIPIFIITISRTIGPIRDLSSASKAVAEGKLDQHVQVKTSDEVGELSESFNKMIDDLQKYREDIESLNQNLEQRVAERTQQLAETQSKLLQSTKLAAVGELAAGIAHELNNPLAGIYAFLQVFADTIRSRGLKAMTEDEAHGFQENFVHVEREIQRCKSIIGSLLTFSRTSEKEFGPAHLNKVLQNTLAFAESNLAEGNITLETHLEEDLPPVMGDSNELQQVFLNIIVNARKAMPESGYLLVVTSSTFREDTACVAISDSGDGIKPDILDKIFDPFFTTSKPGEGTGLGLSISYGIVKNHNGEILVKSQPGEGTTFTVLLPVADLQNSDDSAVLQGSYPEKNEG